MLTQLDTFLQRCLNFQRCFNFLRCLVGRVYPVQAFDGKHEINRVHKSTDAPDHVGKSLGRESPGRHELIGFQVFLRLGNQCFRRTSVFRLAARIPQEGMISGAKSGGSRPMNMPFAFGLTRSLVVLFCMGIAGCSSLPREPVAEIETTPPKSKSLSHVKTGHPYTINGRTYFPMPDTDAENFVAEGIASWYGPNFHGEDTANGELFDMYGMTAAHKTLPLPTTVRVTNLYNGLSTTVRVNDRGPFIGDRIIDLSKSAAEELKFLNRGTAKVRIEVLGIADPLPHDHPYSQYRPKTFANRLKMVRKYQQGLHNETKKVQNQDQGSDPAFFVQVGAFRSRDNAASLAARVQTAGKAQVRPGSRNGDNFFRVLVGPFPSPLGADIVLARLSNLGLKQSRIVSE
ncbi:MAG: rare lipoprotein A [Magnetococcales bacterium]|nr:rare lipoprotein A [Magnetococcales bacterium]